MAMNATMAIRNGIEAAPQKPINVYMRAYARRAGIKRLIAWKRAEARTPEEARIQVAAFQDELSKLSRRRGFASGNVWTVR